jgi:hypothetical protein
VNPDPDAEYGYKSRPPEKTIRHYVSIKVLNFFFVPSEEASRTSEKDIQHQETTERNFIYIFWPILLSLIRIRNLIVDHG